MENETALIETTETVKTVEQSPINGNIKTKKMDFRKNKVQLVTLDEIDASVQEQIPIHGVTNLQFIKKVLCKVDELDYGYQNMQIYAAQNGDKVRPGVHGIKNLVSTYGENAIGTYMFNRLLGKIDLTKYDNKETCATIAFNFHQRGLEIAFGTNVKICQNLSILGGEHIRNYGRKSKQMPSFIRMLEVLGDWLIESNEKIERNQKIITKMQDIILSERDMKEFIGDLRLRAVAKEKFQDIIDVPLNKSQLSKFEYDYLKHTRKEQTEEISLWEVYNFITSQHKPDGTDAPLILENNVAAANILIEKYKLN